MAKLYQMSNPGPRGGTLFMFKCPGCGNLHPIETPRWSWNGSFDKPTFNPSLLCDADVPERRCHSFIKDGMIQFLSDCWHELKDQTVEIPDIPADWKQSIS